MNLGLKDKVVIVTYESKGIVGEISKLLAVEGAIPVLVGKDLQKILDIVKTIHDKNQRASYTIAEITSPENCRDVVDSVKKEFGRIDGLVNSVCLNDGVGLETRNYEGFKESISKHSVHCNPMAHYALPELMKCRGAIVNIDLIKSCYSEAKKARNGLTKDWALELLPNNIRVNAVKDKFLLKNPILTGEEIANTVVFLLSGKSGQITGQQFSLNGGYAYFDRPL
jgi:L-fucose dehydrogenase